MKTCYPYGTKSRDLIFITYIYIFFLLNKAFYCYPYGTKSRDLIFITFTFFLNLSLNLLVTITIVWQLILVTPRKESTGS